MYIVIVVESSKREKKCVCVCVFYFIYNIFSLVALGIEQFLPYVASKPSKFKNKKMQLFDAVQLTHHYLLPCRNVQGILYHISKRRISHDENPIKVYF